MYADREESESRRSVKERLNGNECATPENYWQWDDDKWEHDFSGRGMMTNGNMIFTRIMNPKLQVCISSDSNTDRKVGARDLRLKLPNKNLHTPQSGKSTVSWVRDLQEKLSGSVYSVTVNNNLPKPKLISAKSTKKNETVDAPLAVITKAAIPASRKKNDTSVDGFLHSMGLDKYSITFQAEEVDMAALVHMSDENLKALCIPMILHNLLNYGPPPYSRSRNDPSDQVMQGTIRSVHEIMVSSEDAGLRQFPDPSPNHDNLGRKTTQEPMHHRPGDHDGRGYRSDQSVDRSPFIVRKVRLGKEIDRFVSII